MVGGGVKRPSLRTNLWFYALKINRLKVDEIKSD